ncbi:MAG: metallophosphoesterase [Thermodesulfovibrionales bacterium]
MRIVATSDIHGSKALINLLIHEIIDKEQIDALIIAGDITPKNFDAPHTFSEIKLKQKEGLEIICELLQGVKIPVFMLIGNDDHIADEEWNKILRNYGILNLNMTSYPIKGFKITGFQYVLPTPWNTNNELTEEELGLRLKSMEKQINNKTILVTHVPPYRVLDKLISGQHAGSSSIYKMVKDKQPLFHIFGHIHEAFGRAIIGNTICCNVSCLLEKWILRGYLIDTESKLVRKFMRPALSIF